MGTHHHDSLRGGTLGDQRTLICSSARGSLHTSFHYLSATPSNVSSRLNLCWLYEGFSGLILILAVGSIMSARWVQSSSVHVGAFCTSQGQCSSSRL